MTEYSWYYIILVSGKCFATMSVEHYSGLELLPHIGIVYFPALFYVSWLFGRLFPVHCSY